MVYATTTPGAGMTKGTSCFLVPRETKGFSVARCNETLGGRFMNNGEMVFEDMEVPEEHLLVKDVALARAGVYFRPGKIIQGSKNLGVAVRAYEETVKYVHDYVQGGKKLAEHQGLQWMLADMSVQRDAARGLTYRAIEALMRGERGTMEASAAKLFATEALGKVADAAVQIHGGAGYMQEYAVERLYRDVRLFRIFEGTTQIQQLVIARHMLREA